MKMNIKNMAMAGMASFLLASCVDLDQYPHNTLANEDSFKNMIDARFWVNGMYESLRGSTHGVYMTVPETQTDLLDARKGTRGGNVYRWEEFTAAETSTQNIWARYYKNIANINNAIEGFENVKTENAEEEKTLASYKGQMYLARALYYSRLATLFCKAYDPATATTDLGLPILLKVSVKDLPGRSSLKETYDQILSDISQAEVLLEQTENQVGSLEFTLDAALFLKARVFLYQQQWKQAYEIATKLIDSGTYPLVNSAEALAKMWYDDEKSESIVQLYASVSEPVSEDGRNTTYINLRVYGGHPTYIPEFIPNQWVIDLYEDSDMRKSVYYAQKPLTLEVEPYTRKDFYLVYKYPGNPNLKVGKTPAGEQAPKIFRIAEAYLIAAEAAYMDNNQVNATKYLNLLRTARNASASTKTGAELFQEIKNERVRELSFEGFRLMDLKRWKEGVDRSVKAPQDIDFVVNNPPEQFTKLKKSADDYRMVWPIPSVEIFELGKDKLEQNPGW